ncbi:hypothetical protein WISP_133635 [Willisornis vidua]|uniref:Uncharacterized protein n=1 Tax=Willisornis vidua TaxID=1566151 RepID=A0ABQ9CV13_9PASS|nr:hypothetical protein WISP_133635 [Willisornis vidua]
MGLSWTLPMAWFLVGSGPSAAPSGARTILLLIQELALTKLTLALGPSENQPDLALSSCWVAVQVEVQSWLCHDNVPVTFSHNAAALRTRAQPQSDRGPAAAWGNAQDTHESQFVSSPAGQDTGPGCHVHLVSQGRSLCPSQEESQAPETLQRERRPRC